MLYLQYNYKNMDKANLLLLNELAKANGLVSFVVAKLLKEHKMDFHCHDAYDIEYERNEDDNWQPTDNYTLSGIYYGESNLDDRNFYLAPMLTTVLERLWVKDQISIAVSTSKADIYQKGIHKATYQIGPQYSDSYWNAMMYILEMTLTNKQLKFNI